MSNATLVLPAVNTATTKATLKVTAKTKVVLNDNTNFVSALVNARKQWQQNAYTKSNNELYKLLADCYAQYLAMCADNAKAKDVREQLDAYITSNKLVFKKGTHNLVKIVKCVFGDNKRRVSAYSIVLRTALFHKVKSTELADFIRNNGGVEEIRLAKNGNVLSAKQKAEVAKSAVVTTTLAEFTSEAIAQQLDAANIGEQIVFVATQQADGKFVVNAVSNSTTAVNAALAAYYSANKANINNKQDEQDTTTADEQLTNIVNSTKV